MGYYSDVALKITRYDKKSIPVNQLWEQFAPDKNIVLDEPLQDKITATEDLWLMYVQSTKWYQRFPQVQLIEDWREHMRTLVSTHSQEYTYSWVVVGEEPDDVTAEYLGEHNDRSIFPVTMIGGT